MTSSRPERARSRFLSLVLRHKPDSIGISLDLNGWVDVADLIQKITEHGRILDRTQLEKIVRDCDKQRFSFSEDGQRIRANQGHSVEVELDLSPKEPPAVLYHGTVERFLPAILAQGLCKMGRHHVHLSDDLETAQRVGQRRGRPVVLTIDAAAMHTGGAKFLQTTNGVWLADEVHPRFLRFPR